MSDSIVYCRLYKNLDGTPQHYEVAFSFDGIDIPMTSSTIDIGSQMLSDPTNLVELKNVACTQASMIKALYSNATTITTLNGPVSL